MAVCSIEDAQKELSAIFPDLLEAMDKGNQKYWTVCAPILDRLTTGCRARVIAECIGHELRRIFDGKTDIHFPPDSQTTTMHYKQRFYFRTHKLSPENAVALNYNQACLAFNDNNLFSGILPEPVGLFLGYHENLANHFNPEFMLICPNGDEPYWAMPLGMGTEPPPEQLPVPAVTGAETQVVTRKGQDNKQDEA